MLDPVNGLRQYSIVIKPFRGKDTVSLFQCSSVRRFMAIETVGRREVEMVNAAQRLEDLPAPSGNDLQARYDLQTEEDRIGREIKALKALRAA